MGKNEHTIHNIVSILVEAGYSLPDARSLLLETIRVMERDAIISIPKLVQE